MKKYIEFIIFGLIIFIVGVIFFGIELSTYSVKKGLPINFKSNNSTFIIEYDNNKDYKFIRNIYNDAIKINTIIDENYNKNILIKIDYLETSKLNYLVNYGDKYVKIMFDNDVSINTNHIKRIKDLLLDSILNKTLYDYNLIKYSTVNIYASKEILEKIKIVNYEDRNK